MKTSKYAIACIFFTIVFLLNILLASNSLSGGQPNEYRVTMKDMTEANFTQIDSIARKKNVLFYAMAIVGTSQFETDCRPPTIPTHSGTNISELRQTASSAIFSETNIR